MTSTTIFQRMHVWFKRSALVGGLGLASVLLGSCGGQGVSSETGLQVGNLSLLPNSGSLYANTPHRFVIAGGRRPYFVTSSEQTVLPLNMTVQGNDFFVVPNNPGVVDPVDDPLIVPSRSAIITVRDNAGTQISATYNVLQNFFTGYSLSINSISQCGVADATATVQACAGFESIISMRPTQAGLIRAQRALRLTNNHGDFAFIDTTTNRLVSAVTVNTDFAGNAVAHLFPNPSAFTQYASFRVTDVASGLYVDTEFLILSAPPAPRVESPMTLLPSTVTLAGGFAGQCGVGSVDVLISGGVPPFFVTTASQDVSVTPSVVTSANGIFRARANNPNLCLTAALGTIVVRDSGGNEPVTFSFITTPGTGTPPQPLAIGPPGLCLQNGGTASLLVAGGNNLKVLSSSAPNFATVVPTVTGSTNVTVTAAGALAALSPPVPVTISVFDGASSQSVIVTRQDVCATVGQIPLLVAAPASNCLADGATTTITVSGGANPVKTLTVSNGLASVPLTLAGNGPVTVTATGAGGAGGTPVRITIADGVSTQFVDFNRKTTCP